MQEDLKVSDNEFIDDNSADLGNSMMPDDLQNIKTFAPHKLEAEKVILGSVLLDQEIIHAISEKITPEHFSISVHQKIYQNMLKMLDRGRVINEVTMAGLFASDSEILSLGGTDYLVELAAAGTSSNLVMEYAGLVYDSYIRRQLLVISERIAGRARKGDSDIQVDNGEGQIEVAEQELYNLAENNSFRSSMVSVKEGFKTVLELTNLARKRKGIAGVITGFNELDKVFGGLQKSDLIIIAGRPAMGKTALVTNIAWAATQRAMREKQLSEKVINGAPVGFFSLEMSADQLASRLLSQVSGISSSDIRRGTIDDEQYELLFNISESLSEAPFYIDDTPGQTIASIRSRARKMKRKYGVGLIVLDYIQLVSGSSSRSESRVQEITEITRGLKNLAKELNVPVIALSQLSRQVENREDKRPQMSDLRESGSIEQDADIIMFVYREEYYLGLKPLEVDHPDYSTWKAKLDKVTGKASIIVGKNRHGKTSNIEVIFDGEKTLFKSIYEYEEPEYANH